MAEQNPTVIDSVTTSDGEVITLSSIREAEATFEFYDQYGDNTHTQTNYAYRLDLNGDFPTQEILGYDAPIPEDSIFYYNVSGSLFLAGEAGWSLYQNLDPDTVIMSATRTLEAHDGHPHAYGVTESETQYFIVDSEGNFTNDLNTDAGNDWQVHYTITDGLNSDYAEHFYLSREVNGEQTTTQVFGIGDDTYFDALYIEYLDLDHRALPDNGYFAAAGILIDDDLFTADLVVSKVDADGQVLRQNIALNGEWEAEISGNIVEDVDGNAYYIAEYDPVTATHTGSDDLQTSLWFLSPDEEFAPLTLVGADLDLDSIETLGLSDSGERLDIVTADSSGQDISFRFDIDRDAGTLTLAHRSDAKIYGSAEADMVQGTSFGNKIWTGDGDDHLDGGAGADTLFGGAGADSFMLDTSGSADRIKDFSLAEGDRIDLTAVAGSGTRALLVSEKMSGKGDQKGIAVRDAVDGHLHADIRGPGLADADPTQFSAEAFTGDLDASGRKVIWTGQRVDADPDAATLSGTSGDDVILGSDTTTKIYGGDGDDALFLTNGNRGFGGTGQDLFVFSSETGDYGYRSSIRVTGFTTGEDRLDVTAWGAASIDELELSQRMTGQGAATGDLMIRYDAGSREYGLRLDGAWDAGLGADDFLFT